MNDPYLSLLTTQIVVAYLGHNPTSAADLPLLINLVHVALSEPNGLTASAQGIPIQRPSAAEIRESITPAALVSFEDGNRYKQLKRNLASRGLTPSAYREKWGLSGDYPMVAPNTSAARSEMAKAAGFGTKARLAVPVEAVAPKLPAKPRIRGRLSLFGKRR